MSEQVTFKRNIGLFMAVMIGIGATLKNLWQSQFTMTPARRDRLGPKDQVFKDQINCSQLRHQTLWKADLQRRGLCRTI